MISKDRKLSAFLMYAISNMENRLSCQGFCRNSRFWIQKTFYRSYPERVCLQSYKDIIDDSDQIFYFSIASLALLSVLQLASVCGICRSTDKVFLKDRSDTGKPSADQSSREIDKQNEIEMPERAQRYVVRQRNYAMD